MSPPRTVVLALIYIAAATIDPAAAASLAAPAEFASSATFAFGARPASPTISGRVTGAIHPNHPDDPPIFAPFPNLLVHAGLTQVATDLNGDYAIPCTGATTLTAAMRGLYCRVVRLDGGPPAGISRPASCPSIQDLAWDDSNSLAGERDAYYHINRAHDWVKSIDSGYVASDYDLEVRIHSVDDECSTYWDGTAITFGGAGLVCPIDMASLPDIVYREYAESVNDNLYLSRGAVFGMTSAVLRSATADLMAAFITNDPIIGEGIGGPGTFLRNVDNTRRWPEDASPDPEETGLILAGAYWDLRESIGPVAERLLHFAKYGLPGEPAPSRDAQAMRDYFVQTVIADDDDDDLANGTPHLAEILAAFGAHGIGTGLFLSISHVPEEDPNTTGPFPITAVIRYEGPIGALDAGSPRLHYSVNGTPYQELAMAPTGNPDEWGAAIPGQTGAIVKYYLSAADTYGDVATHPAGAPASKTHVFVAGPIFKIIATDMESDPGWSVSSSPGITGAWTRVDPNTDGLAAPEDDHTPGGTMCWVTGQAPVGEPPGTNDVDGGSTTLTTASFDATGSLAVPIVGYYRWYSNNAADAPASDTWAVDISNNDGASWVPIESTMRSDASWRRVVFFIGDYVTPSHQMRLRFVASDLGEPSLVEAGVDDLSLVSAFSEPGVGDGPAARALALAPASPNPFRISTRLRYTLPAAGRVELAAFDIHGRAVRHLVSDVQSAGAHDAAWDGRDDRGRSLASGPYFIRLAQDGRRSTLAVVRIR